MRKAQSLFGRKRSSGLTQPLHVQMKKKKNTHTHLKAKLKIHKLKVQRSNLCFQSREKTSHIL